MMKESQQSLFLFVSCVTFSIITRLQEQNDPYFTVADKLPLSCTITLISNAIIFTIFLCMRLYDLFTKEFNYHELDNDEKKQLMDSSADLNVKRHPDSHVENIKSKLSKTIINQDVKNIVLNGNEQDTNIARTSQIHNIPNWGIMLCYSLGTATCLACYAVCQFNIVSSCFLSMGFLIISIRETFMRRFTSPELVPESGKNRRNVQNIRFWIEILISILIVCVLSCIIGHAVKLNWANMTNDRRVQEIGGYIFYAVIPSIVWFAPIHIATESLIELSVPISITWSVLVILSKKDNEDIYNTMDLRKNRLWLYVAAGSCLYPAVLYSLFSLTKKGVCLDITAIFTFAALVSYFFFSIPDHSNRQYLNAVISLSCFAASIYAYLAYWKKRNILKHDIYVKGFLLKKQTARINEMDSEDPVGTFTIEDVNDNQKF